MLEQLKSLNITLKNHKTIATGNGHLILEPIIDIGVEHVVGEKNKLSEEDLYNIVNNINMASCMGTIDVSDDVNPDTCSFRGRNEKIREAELSVGIKYPREIIWVDGLEDTPGLIRLPYDDYDKVYVIEGTYDDPVIRFIDDDESSRPYYKKPGDGYTYIYVNHFSGGAGTQLEPYEVNSVSDIEAINNNLLAYYIQTADIDMGETVWDTNPVGIFRGDYDGNNYEIQNFKCTCINAAFFKEFSSSGKNIKNMVFRNADVYSTGGDFGAIIVANAVIIGLSNCKIWDSKVKKIGDCCGAIAGQSMEGVENCFVYNTIVEGSGNRIGGIIGYFYSIVTSYVNRCYFNGSVYGNRDVGGIVGQINSGATFNIYCVDCRVDVTVLGNDIYIGGIIGRSIGRVYVQRCCSTGIVKGKNYVGGIAGSMSGSIIASIALLTYIERTSGELLTFARICQNGNKSACYANEDMLFVTNN